VGRVSISRTVSLKAKESQVVIKVRASAIIIFSIPRREMEAYFAWLSRSSSSRKSKRLDLVGSIPAS
jgi:hypothetical protein